MNGSSGGYPFPTAPWQQQHDSSSMTAAGAAWQWLHDSSSMAAVA